MNKDIEKADAHWVLAQMGKKVLRPGGKELTLELINALNISPKDELIEFAPGTGFTAKVALQNNPESYTAIERDQQAADSLRNIIMGSGRNILQGDASDVPLKDGSANKIYGEAMLNMQANHIKIDIIQEAHRLLRSGGYYGIHELSLTDGLTADHKKEIRQDLARTAKVNARPLTRQEWHTLLNEQGFTIVKSFSRPMQLLNLRRVIDDEGFFRTLSILFNIAINPGARKRILDMKRTFEKHQRHLKAVAFVGQKN